jgi:hypothetical protein
MGNNSESSKAYYEKRNVFDIKFKSVESITLIDINGDTVVVEAGATCTVYRER